MNVGGKIGEFMNFQTNIEVVFEHNDLCLRDLTTDIISKIIDLNED